MMMAGACAVVLWNQQPRQQPAAPTQQVHDGRETETHQTLPTRSSVTRRPCTRLRGRSARDHEPQAGESVLVTAIVQDEQAGWRARARARALLQRSPEQRQVGGS